MQHNSFHGDRSCARSDAVTCTYGLASDQQAVNNTMLSKAELFGNSEVVPLILLFLLSIDLQHYFPFSTGDFHALKRGPLWDLSQKQGLEDVKI